MAYKKETIEMARRLYVVEGKTIASISEMIKVPESTIYKWQRKNEWDKDVQDGGNISLFMNMQREFAKKIKEAMQEGTLTDPSTADALWKTSKLMEKLMPEKVLLSNIFRFLEDITRYFTANVGDGAWLETYQNNLQGLADYLRSKYTSEK